jgi:hypothetical protein
MGNPRLTVRFEYGAEVTEVSFTAVDVVPSERYQAMDDLLARATYAIRAAHDRDRIVP